MAEKVIVLHKTDLIKILTSVANEKSDLVKIKIQANGQRWTRNGANQVDFFTIESTGEDKYIGTNLPEEAARRASRLVS